MQIFRFPILRLVLLFASGIAAREFWKFQIAFPLSAFVVCALVFLAIHFYKPKLSFAKSFLLLFSFGCLGAICDSAQDPRNSNSHFLKHPNFEDGPKDLRVIVREKLKTGKRFQKYVCRLKSLDSKPVCGDILLYASCEKIKHDIPVGQILILHSRLYSLETPKNPGQFDYANYLARKGVFAQVYCERFMADGFHEDIWSYSDRIRKRITSNASAGFGKKELAVFSALLLGQQQEIDADIVRDYQFSGAVHILSVSGLHVGFLMVLLEFLFRFLPNGGGWNLFKLAAIVLTLWGFAVVSGFSPSAVRSVAMFSLVAVGVHLRRSTNIYNTLAVSAMLILTFKPSFLFDVGFQLSYAALFFIVWLKPLFDGIAGFDHRIAKYFWDILKVSFSAQIGTLPLSLYYFHQFPALFFATNMIALPVLGVVMALGFIVVVWAVFAPVPVILGRATSEVVHLMDSAIGWIASFDQFVFRNIWFSFGMLLLSYVLIFIIGTVNRKIEFPKIATIGICIISMQSLFLFTQRKLERHSEFIVFHSKGNSMTGQKTGRRFTFYSQANSDKKDFILNPYAIENNCHADSAIWRNTYYFHGTKILCVDSAGISPIHRQADVLLLVGNPKINLERKIRELSPKIILADGSNFRTCVNRWKHTCGKYKIPFHATAEKGFYSLSEDP